MRHAVSARKTHGDDARRKRTEALVARHMRELFDRLPALAGFRLREDLMVDDLSVFGWSCDSSRGLEGIVLRSLVELAERNPEAVVLMRGRTFARSLH
jgi:hypothetical protein